MLCGAAALPLLLAVASADEAPGEDAPAPVPRAAPATQPDDDAPRVPEVRADVPAEPPRTFALLRGGISNDPTLVQACGEVIPLEGTLSIAGRAWHTGLSIEGCGNGAGFLTRANVPEIAHFRAKWKLAAFSSDVGWFEPIVSAGFAELQTGGDVPGFTFDGPAPGGNATAGPEAGGSLRYKLPLGLGFELLGEAGLSVAYFAYARELNVPAEPFQTSLLVTAGLGW